MLHIYRNIKNQKLQTNNIFTGQDLEQKKYDYKQTAISAYDYKEPSVCRINF